MRIAYIGNFRAPWCTEVHLSATLADLLGHEVVRLQEDEHTAEEVAVRVREEKADLLFWTRTWGLNGDAFKMLRELPCPSVAYHLDLYAPIDRGQHVAADPWWRCTYVFTPDGGSGDFWEKRGINHVYMRPGVYAPECYLATPDPALACDVLFVGAYGYHPEWPYRPQLIDWLKDTYGPRFKHVGHSAETTVRGEPLNRLYASAKVVVGDSLVPNFTHEYYWSDRVYETVGRGGFLIMPWIRGLEDELVAGHHMAYYRFGDFSGLRGLIDKFVLNDDARIAIRNNGHAQVKRCCTYTHRLAEALRFIEEHA